LILLKQLNLTIYQMNFRKITTAFAVSLLLVVHISTAQKLSITDEKFKEHKEAGDKYFEDEEFYLAAQEYHKAEKLKPTDHYTLWKLAESYRLYQDYDDAELWYEKLGAHPDHNYPLAPFWLGLMEKTQGKYIEAEVTLSSFVKTFQVKTEEDKIKLKEAEFEYKGCVFALEQLKKPVRDHKVTLLPSPVNSKATDYAPMIFFHDTSIVITSARADAKGTEMNMATGEARSDNFRFEKNGEKWVRHHNDDNFDIVNTPKDDGAGELTHDHSKYYYTICDPECGIFVSKKVNGKFTKPVKLNKNVNANGYWNAQPTVSPTADTMFFVSKRPGGKGQHDIWMTVNKDKTGAAEDWGPALNMVSINTPYVEITPFWDDHTNTIYFASNGHEGFGGWDIYVAKGAKRDSIVNLGLPFNSSRDDFYFTQGKEKGYLVSNRDGGIGKDDIYTFDIHAKESEVGAIPKDSFSDAKSVASVGRIIIGDNQQPVANLPVYLKNDSGVVIKEARTNANGEFKFENLPPDKNFKIVINESDPRIKTQINYQVEKKPGAATPITSGTANTSSNNTTMTKGTGKVISNATKKPVANVPINMINAKGETVKSTKTNANGQFSVAGLPSGTTYKAKLATANPSLALSSAFKQEPIAITSTTETSTATNNTGEVTGKGKVVNSATNTPASEVPVLITNSKEETVKKVSTNNEGQFFVAGLPGGTTYDAKLKDPDPNLSVTSSFKQEGGNGDNINAKTPIKEPVASNIKSTETTKTTTEPVANNTTSTPNETKTTTTTNTTSTTEPAANSNTPENNKPINTEPAVVTTTTPTENTTATSEPKTTAKPKVKKEPVEEPVVSIPSENTSSRKIATPGTKSKIVIEHKIKSSNRKPSKTLFENVYFDFNSVELTASAKKAIDNLIIYYGNNKEIQIEIKSYSDGFGKPEYNKQLANERGQSCYDYLSGRGVDQTALLLSPLGEGNPVANNNSFAGRQLNRRVEFSIVGAKDAYQPEAMAYVIEPHMTIFSIAKKFGMTMVELKEMNGGIDPADLKAYSTIRVKRSQDAANIAPESIDYVNSGTQEYKFINMKFVPVGSETGGITSTQEAASDDASYTVQPQETLFSIAKRNGLSVDQLMQLNGLADNNIHVGQKLRIK
jgi:outer membrane protein OmpA-like peptidoglycan-associated protein/LysM repeat protein/5-hydroxyisourate hydrolase-like protein (transthyretin family)